MHELLLQELNTFSNGTIGVSCFIMAYQLVRFLVKRWSDGIPFRATIILAAALFFFGGIGRLVLSMLVQDDTVDAVARAMTALVSLLTAIWVSVSIDQALKMKTPKQYEELEAKKDKMLESLRREVKTLARK